MEQQRIDRPSQSVLKGQGSKGQRSAWRWTGLGICALGAVATGFLLLRATIQDGNAQDIENQAVPMFVGWNKPDLAIVISGQMYGYLQPCGCSDPQKGGLERRYNFIKSLGDKGWQVTAVDLGDIAQPSGPQRGLKYEVSMEALKIMGYKAIGLGKNELVMPLTDALARYSINNPFPRPVAVNLANTNKGQLFYDLNVRPGEVLKVGDLKVGVVGAVGSRIQEEVKEGLTPNDKKDIQFLRNDQMLPLALAGLAKENVDLSLLLYQGEEKEAKNCAEALQTERQKNASLAPLHIILCLTKEEEPPAFPQKSPGAPDTSVITIGHKGRYVGVIGVWKKAKGVDLKYQLVAMDPAFVTKPGQEKNHPIVALMEKYAQDVRDGKYLSRFTPGMHEVQAVKKEARYVGTQMCAGCHQPAEAVWLKTAHSHAFATLAEKGKPKLREFDGECVVCHTVGFKYRTGYNDPPAAATAKQLEKHYTALQNVGCESCHGPGSMHANNPQDKALYSLINPYRASDKELNAPPNEKAALTKQRLERIDRFCMTCHDEENDVHWGNVPFKQKWDLIAHPTPKNGVNAANAN